MVYKTEATREVKYRRGVVTRLPLFVTLAGTARLEASRRLPWFLNRARL